MSLLINFILMLTGGVLDQIRFLTTCPLVIISMLSPSHLLLPSLTPQGNTRITNGIFSYRSGPATQVRDEEK